MLTIERRKDDHIEICLGKDVLPSRNWWDDVHMDHSAVPKVDLENVDLSTTFLGKDLDAPLIISAMTGGTDKAKRYNDLLARAASEFGLGFGIGSQRSGLLKPERRSSYEVVKDHEVPLVLGNIGAPQLTRRMNPGKGSLERRLRAVLTDIVEMVDADAICVHLNYLQEAVQAEGECFVTGFEEAIVSVSSDFRLVAKETGAGIGRRDAVMLKDMGFAAIDVGGLSGTSFSAVESYRGPEGRSKQARLGRTFWEWGIPTPVALLEAKVGLPLIATGGLRHGLDLARAIGLGADCGGMARTLLIAASRGYPALKEEIGLVLDELRVAIFLSGAAGPRELKERGVVLMGPSSFLYEARKAR